MTIRPPTQFDDFATVLVQLILILGVGYAGWKFRDRITDALRDVTLSQLELLECGVMMRLNVSGPSG